MFEKVEIYPYQRLAETVITNSKLPKKRKINLEKYSRDFKLNLDFKVNPALIKSLTINNLLIALGGLIMARALVLEEILPFVFAYLAAFAARDKSKAILISIFAVLGFITLSARIPLGTNIFTLFVLLGVLNYVKIPVERTWWGIPLLTLAVVMVAKTIATVTTGISFYTQMVIIFEAMITGILTFVFMVGSDVIENKKPLVSFTFEDMAAWLIIGIGIVMGFNDLYLGGLSISGIICRVGILVAAFLWGSGGGTMVGVMAGIIPSISSGIFAPTLGMYAISGLLAGLFRHFGRIGVIIGFMFGNLIISMFMPETRVTILGIWETGIACLAFVALPSSLKEQVPITSLGAINEVKDVQVLDARLKETARTRIENLAAVFAELSAAFGEEKAFAPKTGGDTYLSYLYDEISQGFCPSCSRYESCWGRDVYSTSQEILDIFVLAENNTQVIYEECPADFKRRCINGREMVNTINYLFDNLRINEYWSDKLSNTKGLVAMQLQGVSEVINNLALDMDTKTTVDFELRAQLLKECKRLGIKAVTDITPIKIAPEQYLLKVIAHSCAAGSSCETDLSLALSSIMNEKYKVCDKKCSRFRGKGPCEFTLTRAFAYKVNSGVAQRGKEKICGDSFTIATLKEGKGLVALSDGMGIGVKACTESQAAVRLLETMLSSGFSREIALKTINSVLMLRSHKDSFATLDMMMVDLYNGEVDFIKTGSAPSFIKRGSKVGIVTSNSLPMGILNEVDIAAKKSILNPHDLVVMVSDGVLEIFRDKDTNYWVADFLTSLNENDPQIVAEMILSKALSLCDGYPNDDMTVVCSYIELDL